VVGVAYPTGRPIRPYTPQELAAGVDVFGRTVPRRPPRRSSTPPIRAAGVGHPASARAAAGVPAGVTPATAMPKARPVRAPVRQPQRRIP